MLLPVLRPDAPVTTTVAAALVGTAFTSTDEVPKATFTGVPV